MAPGWKVGWGEGVGGGWGVLQGMLLEDIGMWKDSFAEGKKMYQNGGLWVIAKLQTLLFNKKMFVLNSVTHWKE